MRKRKKEEEGVLRNKEKEEGLVMREGGGGDINVVGSTDAVRPPSLLSAFKKRERDRPNERTTVAWRRSTMLF